MLAEVHVVVSGDERRLRGGAAGGVVKPLTGIETRTVARAGRRHQRDELTRPVAHDRSPHTPRKTDIKS